LIQIPSRNKIRMIKTILFLTLQNKKIQLITKFFVYYLFMRYKEAHQEKNVDIYFRGKRVFFLASGFVSLCLAILGIFLPVLPTTPFLLLSAYCFSRSSRKWHLWLLNHRYFGKIIRDYNERKGVTLGIKIFALSFLWITILLSVIFVVESILLDFLLISIASFVSAHILKLKTLRD